MMLNGALAAVGIVAAIGCGRGEQRDVGLERTARRDVRPPVDSATAAPNPVPPAAAKSAAPAVAERTPKHTPKSKRTATPTPGDTAPLPAGTPSAAEVAAVASRLGLTIYAAKSQTSEQQARDERRCYAWAHSQTGIDPQAEAHAAQTTGTFAKAMSACLEGKGYTTK